ncbi:MAG TPA: EVE domain-containing protein [Alphaproteobacteria bacterium]|nr:EVE domain-containing protein [Alphaproteobacteria bacterium]
MQYWLMKSEPDAYGWDRLIKEGRGHWDGVRNPTAANNLRAMKKGDRAFFYHSNIGKEIVGVMEIVREAYPDKTDDTGRWVMVDVAPVAPAKTPVTLAQIKADPRFKDLALVKFSRLSVQPVSAAHWKALCKLAGIQA